MYGTTQREWALQATVDNRKARRVRSRERWVKRKKLLRAGKEGRCFALKIYGSDLRLPDHGEEAVVRRGGNTVCWRRQA